MKTEKLDPNLFAGTGMLSDVVLNWYGQPLEKLDSYAQAFHSAAKRLAETSSPDQLRDIGASPVVFLYRHSLELYLKSILVNGSKILERAGNPFRGVEDILKMGHDLSALWDAVAELFEDLDWEWDAENKALGDSIKNFHRVDPKSFAFRYPVSQKGTSALNKHFRFDLRASCERMDEVLQCVYQIDCGLAGVLDQMQNI